MAPKKRVDRRMKRSQGAESLERPSKRRSEQSTPHQAEPSPFPIAPRWTDILFRHMSTGKNIDFRFLENEGFSIGEKIRRQGWEFMCSLKELTYPKLVKEFYDNIKFRIGSVVSLVKGVEIKLDVDVLGRILHMPSNGLAKERGDERRIALESILGRSYISKMEGIKACQLSVEMRLLHDIVSMIFFPGFYHYSFEFLWNRNIYIMFYIIKSIPLNLPAFMLEHMREAFLGRSSRSLLPYGMVLTLIFRQFEVDLDGETMEQLSHDDTYNECSLHRMGYSKVDGQWMRRRGTSREEGRNDENRAEAEAPSSSQRAAGRIQEPSQPSSSQRAAGRIQEPSQQGMRPSEPAAPDHPHDEEQHFEAFGTNPSFELEPRTHQPESSRGPTIVKLDEEQLRMIVEQVIAGLTAARQGESSVREEFQQFTTTSAPPPAQYQAQQTDTVLVPHVATPTQMMTELRLELSDIRTLVTSLHGRVRDVEHEMRQLRLSMQPDQEQGIEMSELAIEAERLRGQIELRLKQVREKTKSLNDSLVSGTTLLQSLGRLLWELETISTSARASSTLGTSSPIIRPPSQPSSSAGPSPPFTSAS